MRRDECSRLFFQQCRFFVLYGLIIVATVITLPSPGASVLFIFNTVCNQSPELEQFSTKKNLSKMVPNHYLYNRGFGLLPQAKTHANHANFCLQWTNMSFLKSKCLYAPVCHWRIDVRNIWYISAKRINSIWSTIKDRYRVVHKETYICIPKCDFFLQN
jgi:hypothetical protein